MINLDRIGWQNGTLVSKAKVEINGQIYEVDPEEYSGTTPLSAENLRQMETNTENAINEVDEKTKIKYALFTTTTASSLGSNTKIALNKVQEDVNSGLTLNNNSIIVGSGISKVRVSAGIFVEGPQGTGYVWGKLRKNGRDISTVIFPYNDAGGFLSTSIPPKIISVNEGDTIDLIGDSTCRGQTRTGDANTWVFAEVIEW